MSLVGCLACGHPRSAGPLADGCPRCGTRHVRDHDATIAALAQDGRGRRTIARELGLSEDVVRRALRRLELRGEPGRPSVSDAPRHGLTVRLTDAEREELRAAARGPLGPWVLEQALRAAREG